jgi:23S rRNA (uracil1939-C5)-methyltransferase
MKFIEHSIRVNGGIEGAKVNDIIRCSQPLYYRDRAQYKLAKNYYGISMGFYKKMSHDVVGINECFIVDEKINKIASAIARFLNANRDEVVLYDEIKNLGYLKHIAIRVNRTGESLITFVVGRARVEDFIVRCTKELKEKFSDIKGVVVNINTDMGNRVFGDRDITVDGENFLEEKVKDITFLLGSDTFFQVNSTMLEAMMDFTGRHINKGSVILDLYGGIGALTLPFHNVASEIVVVDINKKSMELFDRITKLNGISGAAALTADAEIESGRVLAEKKPDVVVLDPPRKGIHPGIIKSIKENRIKEIIYISCNPMTFGRDIKELKDEYDLIEVQPIDLFPNTYHVETMSYLRRKA